MIRTSVDPKGLALSCEIEPADLEIFSDRNAIVHVLQNLLENAVKFTPQGGQIGFRAAVEEAHANVQLIVWATGIGIDPNDHVRIFQPFVQLDSALSRRYEGIGLGLAYAARMVNLLGGTLTIESELGAGSCFIVTLPYGNH
ncbi:MAG: hypothetical protein IPK16_13325 [Anaerolineales bacterium]|nr:hypothetical protein [Anaerolineales bacterium]